MINKTEIGFFDNVREYDYPEIVLDTKLLFKKIRKISKRGVLLISHGKGGWFVTRYLIKLLMKLE